MTHALASLLSITKSPSLVQLLHYKYQLSPEQNVDHPSSTLHRDLSPKTPLTWITQDTSSRWGGKVRQRKETSTRRSSLIESLERDREDRADATRIFRFDLSFPRLTAGHDSAMKLLI